MFFNKNKTKKDENSVSKELNLTLEDEKDIQKEIMKLESSLLIDAEGKGITDIDMINNLFEKYDNKEKLKIFYYGHWVHDRIYSK